jgi:hypothetical protein
LARRIYRRLGWSPAPGAPIDPVNFDLLGLCLLLDQPEKTGFELAGETTDPVDKLIFFERFFDSEHLSGSEVIGQDARPHQEARVPTANGESLSDVRLDTVDGL